MQRELRIFSGFKEAEEADSAFYASLSPQERVDLLLDLVACYQESIGATTERLERVYRITELSRGQPRNTPREFVAAIEQFGLADANSLKDALEQPEKVIQIGRPPNRLDILTSASGDGYELLRMYISM